MRRYSLTALLPALILAATSVAEPVDLKGPAFAEGEVLTMDTSVDTDQANMSIAVQGQIMQGKLEMDMSSINTIEVLETTDGEVSKVRQTIVETKQQMKMTMMGQTQAQDLGGEVDGLTFVQTKTEDGWKTEVEEGNNLPPQAADVFDEMQFIDPTVVYPDKPVDIGESWELTGDQLTSMMGNAGLPGSKVEGDATYTLVEVKEIDGVRTAIINYTMDMQMALPIEEQGMTMNMTIDMVGEGTIHRRLDTYSETNDMKGSMVMNMAMMQGGQVMMQLDADMPMNSTIKTTRTQGNAGEAEEELEGIGEEIEEAGGALQDAAE